jgi:hypothetical protein
MNRPMVVHHWVPVATKELYQPDRHWANRHAEIACAEKLSRSFKAASA